MTTSNGTLDDIDLFFSPAIVYKQRVTATKHDPEDTSEHIHLAFICLDDPLQGWQGNKITERTEYTTYTRALHKKHIDDLIVHGRRNKLDTTFFEEIRDAYAKATFNAMGLCENFSTPTFSLEAFEKKQAEHDAKDKDKDTADVINIDYSAVAPSKTVRVKRRLRTPKI